MEKDNICLDLHSREIVDNAMISPIYQTSSFVFKDFQEYLAVNKKEKNQYTYSRDGNPTLQELETKLALLEKGEKAKVFASGMAAITGTILTLLKAGDHIILVNTVYGSTVSFVKMLEKFNITFSHIQTTNNDIIFNEVKDNTKMVYFESPSSQKFEMLDLETITNYARKKDIYTVIDNTWSTPLFQKPLCYGVDVVIHSCSKYLGGHSDVVGGVVISNKHIIDRITKFAGVYLGATMSSHSAFLILRGIRTLPVRMAQHQKSIIKVLDYLNNSDYIETIYHPYITNDENAKYLTGYGSLFSFVLRDVDVSKIETFVNSLQYFTLAYSWGGFESLILPVYKGNNEEELQERGLKLGHFRCYIGLEDVDLLIEDIKQALHKTYQKEAR